MAEKPGSVNPPLAARIADAALELGLVPDAGLSALVRASCRRHLNREPRSAEAREADLERFLGVIRGEPLAVRTEAVNEQHYEVPTEFFLRVLGPRLKYSCCLFEDPAAPASPTDDLAAAEERMLALTCARADLAEGQSILELGCGWGSLTLYMAERFPGSRILALSNSRTQGQYIRGRAAESGFRNVEVLTANFADFSTDARFDRIVSVEMFEHLRNWELLFRKLTGLLVPGGRLFFHVFEHEGAPYLFDASDPRDWMARHFFAGGLMPGRGLAERSARDLVSEERWTVDGRHYRRTLEAWLDRLDARRPEVLALLRSSYGRGASRRLRAWRAFFLVCAEVFGFDAGRPWYVAQYRFRKEEGKR